jgi:hypothetical protein
MTTSWVGRHSKTPSVAALVARPTREEPGLGQRLQRRRYLATRAYRPEPACTTDLPFQAAGGDAPDDEASGPRDPRA